MNFVPSLAPPADDRVVGHDCGGGLSEAWLFSNQWAAASQDSAVQPCGPLICGAAEGTAGFLF